MADFPERIDISEGCGHGGQTEDLLCARHLVENFTNTGFSRTQEHARTVLNQATNMELVLMFPLIQKLHPFEFWKI